MAILWDHDFFRIAPACARLKNVTQPSTELLRAAFLEFMLYVLKDDSPRMSPRMPPANVEIVPVKREEIVNALRHLITAIEVTQNNVSAPVEKRLIEARILLQRLADGG
jgi:hypothetical protein